MIDNLPGHIAIIMDGNGRWAKKQGLIRSKGHARGAEIVSDITTECSKLGIGYLTLYAFSAENWKRPEREVNFLMKLLIKFLRRELKTMKKNNIRFNTIGRTDEFRRDVQNELQNVIAETKDHTGLVLTLALNYSSRLELSDACRKIAIQVRDGEINAAKVDEKNICENLYTADMPDPDLLIRASGEYRISNFLLWQISYAELWITDVLWPDFSIKVLHKALKEYAGRDRRFGDIKGRK